MTTTPQSMSDLPELPEPSINTANHASVRVIGYTADQLREYGRLCRATAEQAGKVDGFPCSECWSTETVTEENYLGLVGSCPNGHIRWIKDVAKPTQPAATQMPVATVHSSDTPGHFAIITPALPRGTKLYAAPVSPSREVEALVKDTIKREMAAWSDASQRDKDIARLALTSFSAKFDKAIGRLAPVQEKAP